MFQCTTLITQSGITFTHALDRLDCASVIKLFSRDYTIILGIKEHSYVNVQNMCYFDYI